MSYDRGDITKLAIAVKDDVGQLADPDTITLRILRPNGTEITRVYPPSEEGDILRASEGVYYSYLDLSESGTWKYRWEATGGVQLAEEGEVVAAPDTFGGVSGDLTTVSAVREFLQKEEDETTQDIVIQMLITAASRQIARHTSRQFVREDGAEHTFELQPWVSGQEHPPLSSFDPYELRSLQSVTIDPESSSPTVLSAEEFRLWPATKADGTWLGIRINPFNAISPTSVRWGNKREIAVLGDWGMSSIPEDVAQAAVLTVAVWLRRDVAVFESGMNVETGYLERPRALPTAVAAALDESWTRVG